MKGGDSCKLKYSEVKSKEKCCERRGMCFQAACSERGELELRVYWAVICLPVAASEPSAAWPAREVEGLLHSSPANEQGLLLTAPSHGAAASSSTGHGAAENLAAILGVDEGNPL